MILVTGGTGTTGRELVRLLQQSGDTFRVLSRDVARAHAQLGDKVDVVAGDMDDPDSLVPACEGADTLFLLCASDPGQVEQEGRTLEVAEASGVRRVVKLSILGAADDSPVSFSRWHAYTERQLRDSDLAVTILRPHAFMQNTLAFAPSIADSGTFSAPMRDGRIGMIDARDVAAVAHVALTSTAHEGRIVDLTGPQAISYDDVAAILTEELGRPVRYEDVPPNQAEQSMLAAGRPNWYADAWLTLYTLFAAGHASECSTAVQDITGRAPRTYRDFVRDHRQAFLEP